MDVWELIKLVAVPLISVGGSYLISARGRRGEREAKQLEGDASVESKRIDDAAAFRRELREHVREQNEKIDLLNSQIDGMREHRRKSAQRIDDLEIAIHRLLSRFEEFVSFLADLLHAGGGLSEANRKRATMLMRLIETDRAMYAEMERQHEELGRSGEASLPRAG